MKYQLSQLYMITNGSGTIIDPNENVFTSKKEAREYTNKQWTKEEQRNLEIDLQSLDEIIGDELHS